MDRIKKGGSMKSLAKDTAIYGVSTIVGRCLNYLLVPLYTAKMTVESGGYGVITNMYALTALTLIVLTFGMETTFFRYATKGDDDPRRVFSTALIGVVSLSTLFFCSLLLFLTPLSSFLGYTDHPQYVWVMALIVSLDAICAIPFAYLRLQRKALKFVSLKLFSIVLNIGLSLVYYLGMDGHDPGYAFYINLVCSAAVVLCLWKELASIRHGFDASLMRRMFSYAWPILVFGILGELNQVADKILFPFVYPGDDMRQQLAIYGACVKVAMIMAMIKQAFAYAYDVFVFTNRGQSEADHRASNEQQALATKYVLIITLLAFLCVSGWLDVFKLIIPSTYHEGLAVVPIVMVAEIMMVLYFSLSFWYKLSDKTYWGALFSGIGCAVLIAINIIFVPRYSYMACAWAGVAGYGVALVLSFVVGQRLHPVPYPVPRMAYYVLITALSWLSMNYFADILPKWASLAYNTLVIIFFMAVVARQDLPLGNLRFVGKFFRKP